MGEPLIVLFDGDCVLCQGAVRWLIGNDPRAALRFAALDSEPGRRALAAAGGVAPEVDSIVVIDGRTALVRGAAVVAIARRLRAPWPLLARLAALVPGAVRDAVYDAIARRRTRWFGRTSCLLPTAAEAYRFL